MELAVTILAATLLLQGVCLAALVGTLPFLWWRTFKLEAQLEKLDEVLAEQAGILTAAAQPAASSNGRAQSFEEQLR